MCDRACSVLKMAVIFFPWEIIWSTIKGWRKDESEKHQPSKALTFGLPCVIKCTGRVRVAAQPSTFTKCAGWHRIYKDFTTIITKTPMQKYPTQSIPNKTTFKIMQRRVTKCL